MSLLYKIQRTLVTFSLTLMLKDRVPDIQTWKGTWYHKTFEKRGKIRKMQIAILFDYLNAKGPIFDLGRHGKKIKYKCLNEILNIYSIILSIYCIILGFTSLKLFKTIFFVFIFLWRWTNSNLNLFELVHLNKPM